MAVRPNKANATLSKLRHVFSSIEYKQKERDDNCLFLKQVQLIGLSHVFTNYKFSQNELDQKLNTDISLSCKGTVH